MGRKLTEVASRLASQTTPRQVVYIVDFENIPKTDVAALLLEANVSMVVLAANHTNTVTPATLRTIEANPERMEVIIGRVTRKEFVDKLVTAKIGEYAFRFPLAEIIVLANDKDYADLAVHLNDHWERAVPIRHVAPDGARSRAAGRSRKSSEKAAPNVVDLAEAAVADEPKKRPSRRGRGGGRKRTTPDAATTDVTADEPKASAKPKTRRTKAAAPKEKAAAPKEKAAAPKPKAAAPKPKAAAPKAKSAGEKPAKPVKAPRARTKRAPTQAPTQAPTEAPAAETTETAASAMSTNPDANVILALLSKMPTARRPKSASSLLNAVRNYREAMGLRSRPTTIIKHLQSRGLLNSEVSPVVYNLDAGT